MNLDVRPLALELFDDYVALFDTAFPDNPGWAGCYCGFYDDTSGEPWDPEQDPAAHREARRARIAAGLASGLLAYAGGRPIGWCNVAPRSRIPNLRRFAEAIEDPAQDPALVMCFVIAPDARGQGVATALLDAAIEAARGWGSPWIEAYPAKPDTDTDGLPWTAAFYKGPLVMYERAGFTVARDMGWWVVARRPLT
ncbi:MAG TPA: GNAT family N-acetyltransferase [Candidatus Nanopelagicales bacterium]